MKIVVIFLILSSAITDIGGSLPPPLAADRSCRITRSGAFGVINTVGSKPQNCTWIIKTPPGSNVELYFPYLTLSQDQNCTEESNTDHILISSSAVKPIFLCYNRLLLYLNMRTSTANITLNVKNDATSKAEFRLFWRILDSKNCNKNFNEPTGIILSPNYPNEIPTAISCTYNITAPEGFVVRLKVSQLSIQTLASDLDSIIPTYKNECINYLRIRDEGVQIPVKFTQFCDKGFYFPGLIYQSMKNKLAFVFDTFHPLRQYQGFVAAYETVPESLASDIFKHSNGCIVKPAKFSVVTSLDVDNKDRRYDSSMTDHSNCSREFHEQSGVIMSPNYPNGIDSAVSCIYKIVQLPGTVIRFRLTHFTGHNSTDKTVQNYLEIRDGSNESSPPIKIIKEKQNFSLQPPIKSKNSMIIKFVTSGSLGHSEGFHAVYSAVPENSEADNDDSFCIYASKDDD